MSMDHERDEQAVEPRGHQGHTPGPWAIPLDDWWVYSQPTGKIICGEIETENEADYHLIAAAPDLDAAADEAWKALAWIINYDSEDKALASAMKRIEAARKKAGTFDYDAMRAQVEATGRAAIAKATGAQP